MKLLIITQKVDKNDANLGFFHKWLEEFENTVDLKVICLEKGESSIKNVFSLGKENGKSKIKYLFNFYKYILSLDYDCVFVHMNQIYVLLGFPFWFNKRVFLWYVHKSVGLSLKIAEKLVNKIFTASEKSFRLPSKKVVIVGHGIDTDLFKYENEGSGVCTVGRISKSKNIHIILDAVRKLNVEFKVAGEPITEEDKKYVSELRDFNWKSMKHAEISEFLNDCNVFVNLSDTGSLDKAILEAMACDRKILTSNEAFSDILDKKYFTSNSDVLGNLNRLLKDKGKPNLSEYVIKNHSLKGLTQKLLTEMKI